MSGKLDQSLDEIISTQRRTTFRAKGGRRVRRSAHTNRAVSAYPAGGIKKIPRAAKGTAKTVPTGPSASIGNGKIIVTGLVSIESCLMKRKLCF